MNMPEAVQGARHLAATIQWTDTDGDPVNLTGATLSGRIKPIGGSARAVDGTLTITGATTGLFTWTYGATDVGTAGRFEVQFKATYADTTYALSIPAKWRVHTAL